MTSALTGSLSSSPLSAAVAQAVALGYSVEQAETFAAELLGGALDGTLIELLQSQEVNAQRNRDGRRQLWNVGYRNVAGSSTTYWTATATDQEIARGTIFHPMFLGAGVIDFEVDGELNVEVPEVGLTVTFKLQTCPLPSAYPEVWTTIATWVGTADPGIGPIPRQFWTRGRLRARGNTGSVQQQTWNAQWSCDPLAVLVTQPLFDVGRGKVNIDTRDDIMLRITFKIDGVPSAARRATVWGSFAEFCPRSSSGN